MKEQLDLTQPNSAPQVSHNKSLSKRKRINDSSASAIFKTPRKSASRSISGLGATGMPLDAGFSGPPTRNSSSPTKKPRIKQGYVRRESTQPGPRMKQEYSTEDMKSPPHSSHPYMKQESIAHRATPEPEPILLSGTYSISCPVATDMFPDIDPHNLTLTLLRDDDRNVWWATFCWGAWDGIMQMSPGLSYHTLGQACSLGWRLRDLDTGELKFGRKCTGEMTVYNDQTLSGCLFQVPHVGTVEFWGDRMTSGSMEDGLQDEWDRFVYEAYGRL